MNKEQLARMADGKGFIAALDQSGGSTPKALRLYGIPDDAYHGEHQMFDLIHDMRKRIIQSPAFTSTHILAAILFEQTMDREIDGVYTGEYLWKEKGIVPFVKVDQGLDTDKFGVQLMKPLSKLDELLSRAKARHIFGTKMRSVIHEANRNGIAKIVEQQFEVGLDIIGQGFMPILEPEVDIHSSTKAEAEVILLEEIFKRLTELPDDVRLMFKLTIPSQNDFYGTLIADSHVLRCVALSGGYSREDANKRLAQNPGLIASFSRGLTEGLNIHQSDIEFNYRLKESIQNIYNASIS
ncbi:MAG: fructose bisphosphate aldolase [Eubacterium aggregans]|uniref:fructose-bisphosphate aldolase n=1 Tax=Eubacterium aggregans TaxID=81409 RepID=A0A1H4CZI5_9FIRM|nr:fructose bisphosphate aldolase [Eubacterium aggregans]MDD4691985.1 fructose bisphosphate aldolase [Eubacterium aggregans]MEA5072965.1 fructose bisphosphate aldolase [Eubacterium aggregans]SEA65666.1 fructose-bisphosphate aldolase, class I [Eubacterium aggregans]